MYELRPRLITVWLLSFISEHSKGNVASMRAMNAREGKGGKAKYEFEGIKSYKNNSKYIGDRLPLSHVSQDFFS